MSIFSVEAGERVHITTETVSLEMPDLRAKGMLKKNVSYWATATDQFQVYDGVKRRLFTDMSEDFGLGRTIWLSDGPAVARQAPAEIIYEDILDAETVE